MVKGFTWSPYQAWQAVMNSVLHGYIAALPPITVAAWSVFRAGGSVVFCGGNTGIGVDLAASGYRTSMAPLNYVLIFIPLNHGQNGHSRRPDDWPHNHVGSAAPTDSTCWR